jgi:hypothetical protein
MGISIICEKAGAGMLNASKATTTTISDIGCIAFMARFPPLVAAVDSFTPKTLCLTEF